jgi:hypothetical protein
VRRTQRNGATKKKPGYSNEAGRVRARFGAREEELMKRVMAIVGGIAFSSLTRAALSGANAMKV